MKRRDQAVLRLRRYVPLGCRVAVRVHQVYPGNVKRVMAFFALRAQEERQLDTDMADLFSLQRVGEGAQRGLLIDGVRVDVGRFYVYELAKKLYGDEESLQYERDRD